eukprot:CAMPEP_0195289652 /NCGR_PEP_ID=MMETSP0707-20130614/5839_1 /TAXON_ID=33640 /ORGANISM="Asterionellopsis glacialis, Strain CCMP134" /LENGTH=463 /DNA_ID=CAMNT_0040349677 /DNA_START=57 /DNA_END=1448 /DNA_ORIENTATION=+
MRENRTEEFFSLARSLDVDRLQARPASITSQGIGSSTSPQQDGNGSSSTVASASVGRYGGGSAAVQRNRPPQANSELRSFHVAAGEISKDIAATSAMLSELTQLVKSKSLFVDDSSKVNMLVVRIKGNIENLNGRLDEAAEVISHQKRRLGRHSQAGQEASNLVGQLQEEFVEATAGFKKVLQERTDTLKDTTDQKRRVYGAAEGTPYESGGPDPSLVSLENKPIVYEQQPPQGSAALPSSAAFGGGAGGGAGHAAPSSGPSSFPTIDLTSQYGSGGGGSMSAGESTGSLPRPHGARGEGGGSDYTTPGMRYRRQASEPIPSYSGSTSTYAPMGGVGGGTGTGAEPMTPLDIQRMEQASGQDQMMQLIPDQDYLRERADAMSTVETNIVELGTIFNKLAVMVSEHREMVQRVEDNVDDANTNIMLSMETLTDTLNNLRTNKQLFMKVFSVLVLFIVLFITFFA